MPGLYSRVRGEVSKIDIRGTIELGEQEREFEIKADGNMLAEFSTDIALSVGPNEEVVLFVQPDGQGNVRCVYETQGKFAVGGNYIVGFDLTPRSLNTFRQRVDELVIRQEDPR